MLVVTGQQALIDVVNAEASLSLAVADVEFGTPAPLDEVGSQGEDTVIQLRMLSTASARGVTKVRYHRQRFDQMFTDHDGINPLVVPAPTTSVDLYGLLANMRRFCGLDLQQTDVENALIDRVADTVLLQAKPGSIGWAGQITAKLVDGDAVLPDVFTEPELTGLFAYPNINTKLGQASIYSYRFDFSEYGSDLRQVTAANINLLYLVNMLTAVTKDRWTLSRNPLPFNLQEAKLLYNGLNNNPTYVGNPNFSRVMILELAFYNLSLGGLLFIHYNA